MKNKRKTPPPTHANKGILYKKWRYEMTHQKDTEKKEHMHKEQKKKARQRDKPCKRKKKISAKTAKRRRHARVWSVLVCHLGSPLVTSFAPGPLIAQPGVCVCVSQSHPVHWAVCYCSRVTKGYPYRASKTPLGQEQSASKVVKTDAQWVWHA